MATGSMPMREATVGRLSLRTRMVLLSSAIVTIVLVAAGLLFGVALRASLVDNVTESAVVRAEEIADLARRGVLPPTFPVADDDEAFVQVVRDGQVVASSVNVGRDAVVSLPPPLPGRVAVYELGDLPLAEDDGGFLVAAATTATLAGATTVYAAASLEDVRETVGTAAGITVAGLPLVVAALAAAMWLVVGRTLRPVEQIRAEADAISGQQLHRRVPEPGRDDEIGRLARTLNAMLARLEGSVERQRRFVADAAHELRSPIASLRTQLETARESAHVDWGQRSIALLDDAVRMERLTEQLLLLAHLDADAPALRRRPVDLDDIVMRAAARLRADATVELDLSGVRPAQVPGDPILLEQLVANLLDNALRHARRRVRVRVEQDGHDAFVQVDDDGPGIPVERRDDVLQRFTRLEDARERTSGGVGLGLAIASDIARAHDGRIEISDGALGGAAVRGYVSASR